MDESSMTEIQEISIHKLHTDLHPNHECNSGVDFALPVHPA
jgi:hypothetical protein